MSSIQHTAAFDLAYKFVTETNLSLFLTGKAGTGKTTFLKYLKANTYKNMIVAAPTGVAAINAGGVTLHSLFQLPFTPYIPAKENREGAITAKSLLAQLHFNREKLNLFRNLELLVIDESSMVASHTVDAIDVILRSVRRNKQVPFGGVQLLFIGDLHQLSPVVKSNEWYFLKDYYPSIFFFDSLVLREHVPVMIELNQIFRQQDNDFIDILNGIRHNTLSQQHFDRLNQQLNRNFSSEEGDGFITLTTHNNQADAINKKQLEKLSAKSKFFEAEIRGDFPPSMYPAEQNLELKMGAQVMFLKNDLEEKKYYNGKLGVITGFDSNSIQVKCKGQGETISVKRHEWKNTNYSLNSDTLEIEEEDLGSFQQFPLRLAWAITIHKSQGLTFDKLVIDAEKAFANGQVYVALSRCTSLEGLVLTSPINREFLGAHKDLEEWQKENHKEELLPEKLEMARRQFIMQELQRFFSLENWQMELYDLLALLKEFEGNLPMNAEAWLQELIVAQKQIQSFADRFKENLLGYAMENPNIEQHELAQKRLTDASHYFIKEIAAWKEKFYQHPLSTDTKKVSKKIDPAMEQVAVMIHKLSNQFRLISNGFYLDVYLKERNSTPASTDKIQSCYAQNQNKTAIPEGSHHEELYQRIAEMRKRIGDESNKPLFQIFNNAAIKNVCEQLPGTKAALLMVKGFGKTKVKQYGDEILELVHDYCEENNLVANEIFEDVDYSEKKSKKLIKGNTVEETLNLFREGIPIQQIAAERKLTYGTIEGHLAQAVEQGKLDIEALLPIEEVEELAKYFPQSGEQISLTALMEQLPFEVSYGKLKMVRAWMTKQ